MAKYLASLTMVGCVKGFGIPIRPSGLTFSSIQQAGYSAVPGRAAPSLGRISFASTAPIQRTRSIGIGNDGRHLSTKTGVSPPAGNTAETIFSKIIRKEIPAQIVYEDDLCLAFKDIAPAAPVHILVIPKTIISQLSKTKAEVGDSKDVKEMLGHLLLVAADIGRQHCPEGFRYVINDGKEGLQSVYHLHIHVIGGKRLSWPPGV